MAKRIALFNHKGGVSKTTTAFNLSWKLAERGHRVVVADTDPQCNLTGLVLGFKGPSELENFYRDHADRNIYAGLTPAFESRPIPIGPIECVEVIDGMFLLPGNIRLSEYETTLGIAQELSGSIHALQNLPGAMVRLFEETAAKHSAEYIIIDMSPGLGAINQNLMATSDYLIVPTAPDFFSVMAIDSLARVLPRWHAWARQASEMDVLRNAAYPFPAPSTKLLGAIVQNFRPRGGAPASSFKRWIDELGDAVRDRLVPAARDTGLLLPDAKYAQAGVPSDTLIMVQIPDFNSLVALSQDCQKPVFALDEDDTRQSGVVLEGTLRNRDQFNTLFEGLAEQVSSLTA
ncbi:MAG: ParA family protein [Thermoleophilia bacterium]